MINDFDNTSDFGKQFEDDMVEEDIVVSCPEFISNLFNSSNDHLRNDDDSINDDKDIDLSWNRMLYFESVFENSQVVEDKQPQPATVEEIKSIIDKEVNSATHEEINKQDNIEVHTLHSKRRDVIIKSILRAIRRYFCNKLETNTIYKRKEKKIKVKHENLIKCSKEITNELSLDEYS